MAEQTTESTPQEVVEPEFIRLLVIAMLFTFGIMMLIFSFALSKDINLLRDAPGMVWAFICGAPNPDGPALPLLLTFGTLALIGGFVASGWHWWHIRRKKSA